MKLLKEENNFPPFIINMEEINKITSLLSFTTKKEIIKSADNICNHNFNILGSGDIEISYNSMANGFENNVYHMNLRSSDTKKIKEEFNRSIENLKFNCRADVFKKYNPIDWHKDYKSGYRWNSDVLYTKIKYGRKSGADIKVPWELSRFHHLVNLGQAYLLTKDEKYTREFVSEIIDWVENNPLKIGINWACTMEVAIRVCNLIAGFYLFKNSQLLNVEFLNLFFESIYNHGKHIYENLEFGFNGVKKNHFLSNIVGLIYVSQLFSGNVETRKWRSFAIKELISAMDEQVYDDGVSFEASTCYHRLVLELFFYSTLLIIINDDGFKGINYYDIGLKLFGKKYLNKLFKMFEFILVSIKPNGEIPQIGDNDNSRLHIFANRKVLDMRYLLVYASIFFGEKKFKIGEFGFCNEALWLFGTHGYYLWEKLDNSNIKDIKGKSFCDSGWHVVRNNNDYLFISAGPIGQRGLGGHTHNDKLSFELNIGGVDVIIDPGTYAYTASKELRNMFRSVSYHNTVQINTYEQNRFNRRSIFMINDDLKIKFNRSIDNSEFILFDIEYKGCKNIAHRRLFIYNKKFSFFIIKDFLLGMKIKNVFAYISFHFPVGDVEICKENKHILVIKISDCFKIKILQFGDTMLDYFIKPCFYSKQYGEKQNSSIVKYFKKIDSNLFASTFCIMNYINKVDYIYIKKFLKEISRVLV